MKRENKKQQRKQLQQKSALDASCMLLIQTSNSSLPSLVNCYSISKSEPPHSHASLVYNFSQSAFLIQLNDRIFCVTVGETVYSLLQEEMKLASLTNMNGNYIKLEQYYKQNHVQEKFYVYLNGDDNSDDQKSNAHLCTAYMLFSDPYYELFFRELQLQNEIHFNPQTLYKDQQKQYKPWILVLEMIIDNENAFLRNKLTKLKINNQNVRSHLSKGEEIYAISSPFGIMSSEMYKNLIHKGIISNIVTLKHQQTLFLLDILSIEGMQGCPIYDGDFQFAGMVLNTFQQSEQQIRHFLFGIPASTIITIIKTHILQDQNKINFQNKSNVSKPMLKMSQFICAISTDQQFASGILINKTLGLILSVGHAFDKMLNGGKASNIDVQFYWDGPDNTKQKQKLIFKAMLLVKSRGSFDLSLLQIVKSQLSNFRKLATSNFQSDLHFEKENEGFAVSQQVMAIGQGIFLPSFFKSGNFTNGILSKIIYSKKDTKQILLLATDCKIYNGYSGGGIFSSSNGKMLGIIIFNLKQSKHGEVINEINYGYAFANSHIKSLVYMIQTANEQQEDVAIQQLKDHSIWTLIDEQLDELGKMETRKNVPIFQNTLQDSKL